MLFPLSQKLLQLSFNGSILFYLCLLVEIVFILQLKFALMTELYHNLAQRYYLTLQFRVFMLPNVVLFFELYLHFFL